MKKAFLLSVVALCLLGKAANAQDSLNVRQVGLINDYWATARAVEVTDTLAYVATGRTGLRIMNIADPANPIEIGYYDSPGSTVDMTVVGNYAYVADGEYL